MAIFPLAVMVAHAFFRNSVPKKQETTPNLFCCPRPAHQVHSALWKFTSPAPEVVAVLFSAQEVSRLRDLSPQQWKSGIAAWLGWLFDGLDMHLYVLVAAPFVMELLGPAGTKDE